jgi:glycosyltransferase involved in cell wall biosynthesis
MIKIAHLTSPHSRNDTRIFIKECSSLANVGYDVSLVVADGMADELKKGVKIFGVKKYSKRLDRMKKGSKVILKKALEVDANLYHIHDPELILIGLKLMKHGKKVIFDAHEDLPKQILGKPYLNRISKYVLPNIIKIFESWSCKRFDGIVTATPFIRDKFLKINPNTLDINNFPLLEEFSTEKVSWENKLNHVCYIGGISSARGVKETIQAMACTKTGPRLQLGGNFSEADVEKEVKSNFGWQFVDELGWLDRIEVSKVFKTSVAGIVNFLPIPNHIEAQPNKMFEYMSAGIPVIASDFPLWRKIIGENDCGICVDPSKPESIAEAIDFVINNPERAQQMGENGRVAVQNQFNWKIEAQKLINFYSKIVEPSFTF